MGAENEPLRLLGGGSTTAWTTWLGLGLGLGLLLVLVLALASGLGLGLGLDGVDHLDGDGPLRLLEERGRLTVLGGTVTRCITLSGFALAFRAHPTSLSGSLQLTILACTPPTRSAYLPSVLTTCCSKYTCEAVCRSIYKLAVRCTRNLKTVHP